MLLVLLQFIPLSFAAITPTMVIFVTALLANDHNPNRALAVVLGRLCGLLIAGFASLFLIEQLPEISIPGTLDQPELLPAIFLIVGIALMLAAGYTTLFGQVPTEQNQRGLLDRFRQLNVPVLFAACLLTLFVSIRQLSLLIAGTAIIKSAEVDHIHEIILLVVLCVLMIWAMLIPLALEFGMGARGKELLGWLGTWMQKHQRGINTIVLAFFGGVLISKGISGL